MVDILEGTVLEVVDGEVLEVEVERVQARDAGHYGAREWIRVGDVGEVSHAQALDEEAAARMVMDYENRRVRLYVQDRDDQGRLIGDVEVLSEGQIDEPYGLNDEGE